MPNKSIVCPVCKISLQAGISVCPDCKQDLSALIYLERQSEILYNQGLSLIQAGQDEQAIELLKKALDLDKSNLLAALVLGKIYARRKEYLEARTVWNQAQQIYPESVELHEQLAVLGGEIDAAQSKEAQIKVEAERQERISKRRKIYWMIAQISLAFIFGCAALAVYQFVFRSTKPGQQNEAVAQVDITTLQAFQTAAVMTMEVSQSPSTPSATPFVFPSATPTPTLSPIPILPTATVMQPSSTVNPTANPTVQDLLPLVEQAIARDPSLSSLGLEFTQSGSFIYVMGEAPDIRTRYLIEVTVHNVPGVEGVDMSSVTVVNGDITSAPTQCVISTGVQGGKVNLRDGPGTRFNVIGVLTEGDVLSIAQLGNWYQVITGGGITGWISSNYCLTK